MKKYEVKIIHTYYIEACDEQEACDIAIATPYGNANNCEIECEEA